MEIFKKYQILISAISLILAIVGGTWAHVSYLNNTYARIDKVREVNGKINKINSELEILKSVQKNRDGVLCGMAIDLDLPTAKEECKILIQQ